MTAGSSKTTGISGSVLEKILKSKKREVAAFSKVNIPPRVRRDPVSLKKALKKPGPGFILECKRASPSLGDIRPDADLEDLVRVYAPFADAISVLTDKTFFKGSLQDLESLGKLTSLPLLAKDFFIDEIQIKRAYSAGADAILLMLSVLDDAAYLRLAKAARNLGLEILTEIHTAKEMVRANALGAKIIGINNRDLKTLKVDIETTRKLAPLARKGVVLVSESGFSKRQQIMSLAKKVHGFLIGSSLMAVDRPDLKLRQMVFGEIKICGLTRPEDAKHSYQSGATFGGLNFVEGTPRAIEPGDAKKVMADTPLKWVGVFRNSEPNYIAAVASVLDLDAVQLHGVETEQFRTKLRKILLGKAELWQAVEGTKYVPEVAPDVCDRLILDSKRHRIFGGTGFAFGWGPLKKLKKKAHLGLAGGLVPGNMSRALKTGIPLLDVCSGVEESHGKKSPEKITALFQAIRKFAG